MYDYCDGKIKGERENTKEKGETETKKKKGKVGTDRCQVNEPQYILSQRGKEAELMMECLKCVIVVATV